MYWKEQKKLQSRDKYYFPKGRISMTVCGNLKFEGQHW